MLWKWSVSREKKINDITYRLFFFLSRFKNKYTDTHTTRNELFPSIIVSIDPKDHFHWPIILQIVVLVQQFRRRWRSSIIPQKLCTRCYETLVWISFHQLNWNFDWPNSFATDWNNQCSFCLLRSLREIRRK